VEANQVDVLAPPVFRDLEEVDDSLETRSARDCGGDVGIGDREERVHLDLTFVHPVPLADRHVRTHPYAHAAGDFAPAYSLAQTVREEHPKSLTADAMCLPPPDSSVCPTTSSAERLHHRPRVPRIIAEMLRRSLETTLA
jgi:hypothetical protein